MSDVLAGKKILIVDDEPGVLETLNVGIGLHNMGILRPATLERSNQSESKV